MAPAPIRYTYAWGDYVALSRVVRRESFWRRNQTVVVPALLTLGMLAGILAVTAWKGNDVGRALRFVLTTWHFWLLPPTLIVLILFFNRLELGMWYRKQKIDGVDVAVSFDDPKGLRTETKDGSSVIAWRAIRKVETEGDMHVVLQQNRIVGVCLPRRAFASDADFAAAKTYIEDSLAQDRSSPA
jgi:hypothetical protein